MYNEKICFLTDSACDISREDEERYKIRIMGFPVTIDGKGYRERESFTPSEFYALMDQSEEIPRTAQITTFEFEEAYARFFEQRCSSLIHVSINATASNTFNAANMAKKMFFKNNPEAVGKMDIFILDSQNYSVLYGYPLLEAAKKAEKGCSVREIIDYLQDWFDSALIVFAPFTLKYVKKSGRVSCAAAFVGEVLGLRPIIELMGGRSTTIEKVRGDRAVIPKLAACAVERMIPQTPYALVVGSNDEANMEAVRVMTKLTGYPPEKCLQMGASIASNAGHNAVGIAIKGTKRR